MLYPTELKDRVDYRFDKKKSEYKPFDFETKRKSHAVLSGDGLIEQGSNRLIR